ncbi:MAG: hypothetical protein LBU65_16880 [Planctomycetaceae bacterium]|jgi:hypothetical protein|nr:hypothetical protein [Planctomycetaceae bacterium]
MRSPLRQTVHCVLFALFCFTFVGCSEPRPDDLPKLQSVVLTFTQDGQPCDGATVFLEPVDQNPWGVGGATNSSGVVVFKTHGKYVGAPAGKYKVVVQKIENELSGPAPDPNDMYAPQPETNSYNLVDTKYENAASTPLEIEVVQGTKFAQTFELGKKIKEKLKKPGEK